jgi:hypothetical protein
MKIDREIYKELKYISTLDSCQERLKLYLKLLKPVSYRTLPQNNAIHVNCHIIAEKLNEAGKDMKQVLKQEVDIPWDMKSVKEFLWKPIMTAKTGKKSTTELDKTNGEIEEIHKILMKHLGEKHFIEYHEFPSKKESGYHK